MSSNYTYPGQSYAHTLTALKGWYRETALDAEVKPTTNVNIGSAGLPLQSGLTVHAVGVGTYTDPYGGAISGPSTFTVEMGCGSDQGLPIFLWSGSNEPDITNPGVPAGTSAFGDSTYGPPDFGAVFPGQTGTENMAALVGSGAYELETTEFDTDQTYAPGQYLRTVTSNTSANAGKVTNQRATTSAFGSDGLIVPGTDTVVGIVSRGKYVNANRKNALAFWCWFVRGTR